MSDPKKPPPGFRLTNSSPPPPAGFRLVEPDAPPQAPPTPEQPSAASSALQGFGQGASYGFVDELAGLGAAQRSLPPALQALTSVVSPAAGYAAAASAPDQPEASSLSDVVRAYLAGRQQQRDVRGKAEAANPKVFTAGQFAGAAMTPGPKGAGAGRLAKQGALYGGLAGLGGDEADLTQGELLPALANTAVSAGTGAILAPVASGLSNRFARFLKERSQVNALKAVGAKAGISDALGLEGIKTVDDARALGQTAIDQGLVPPFSTAANVAENSGFALERQGARIAGVLADADAPVPVPGMPGATFPPKPFDFDAAAWRAAQEAMGPEGLTTEAIDKARPAGRIIDRILKQGQQDPTFSAANRLKSNIYEGINYGTDPALSTRLQQSTARGLRSSIEEQIGERLGPDAVDELRAANRAFGSLKKIQGLSSEEARRAVGRAGPFSAGTVGASLAAGNPTPMLFKAAEPFIPSTLSALQRGVSPAVTPVTQGVLKPGLRELSDVEEDAIAKFTSGGI